MKYLISTLIISILCLNVLAQEDDQILIKELKQSTVINEPATLHKGFFKLSGLYFFGVADKIFTEESKRDIIGENGWAKQSTYLLGLQYGVTNRLELVLDVPFESSNYFYSQNFYAPVAMYEEQDNWELSGKGLGDISFAAYYQIIEGSKTKPSLTARLTGTFPTGEKNPTNVDTTELFSYDLPTGYGETTVSLDLVFRKIMYPFSYSAYGSMTYSFGGEKMMRSYEDPIKFKSGNNYYFGGKIGFMLNDWIAIENDVSFFLSGEDEYKGETDAEDYVSWVIHYEPDLVFQLKRFRFAQKVLVPLFGKNASADPGYVILLQYIF